MHEGCEGPAHPSVKVALESQGDGSTCIVAGSLCSTDLVEPCRPLNSFVDASAKLVGSACGGSSEDPSGQLIEGSDGAPALCWAP